MDLGELSNRLERAVAELKAAPMFAKAQAAEVALTAALDLNRALVRTVTALADEWEVRERFGRS